MRRRLTGALAGLALLLSAIIAPVSFAAAQEPDRDPEGVSVSVEITPLACPRPPGKPGAPGRPPYVPGPPSHPCHPGNPGNPTPIFGTSS